MYRTLVAGIVGLGLLAGCGTTFTIPKAANLEISTATQMFEEARRNKDRAIIPPSAAQKRFTRVLRRVKPAGKKVCEEVTADIEGFICDVDVQIDTKMPVRNAYFTYIGDTPVIRMSMPLLKDTESDDEVAFVMSHEFGHLIGRHIDKQKKQALTGAIIMGAITAYGNAYAASAGQYYDPNDVTRNMELGAAVGSKAYSQTYELESDTLGTYIAKLAGYDPINGAKFFARPEDVRTKAGKLSFWGTHPPNAKRLATVIATVNLLEENGGRLELK
jgi:Zn-dependent protease with chaperone function